MLRLRMRAKKQGPRRQCAKETDREAGLSPRLQALRRRCWSAYRGAVSPRPHPTGATEKPEIWSNGVRVLKKIPSVTSKEPGIGCRRKSRSVFTYRPTSDRQKTATQTKGGRGRRKEKGKKEGRKQIREGEGVRKRGESDLAPHGAKTVPGRTTSPAVSLPQSSLWVASASAPDLSFWLSSLCPPGRSECLSGRW